MFGDRIHLVYSKLNQLNGIITNEPIKRENEESETGKARILITLLR